MATHSVEQHLGLRIEGYDREIRRLVPGYDALVAEGLELLRRLAAPTARLLDLGCGTGRMSGAILDARPGATVIALDVDPKALDEARLRLRPYPNASGATGRSRSTEGAPAKAESRSPADCRRDAWRAESPFRRWPNISSLINGKLL